jgi:hypothetical protein
MKPLYECMVDPDLFGRTFGGPTFEAWRTVAKALDALPLDAKELALYQSITGRTAAPTEPFDEAYLVKPRRAGGTLFGAACGVHAALEDYRPRLGPGEWATVALIASDRRQARQIMGYVKGLVHDSPIIEAELARETEEQVEFTHRCRIEVHTGSFRSTRGYSYACVLLDELAFYRDDLSANPDVELVRAVRPGLANLHGRLLGFSSPHSRRGHLWDMYRSHYGKASSVLVIQAPGRVLNPTIDEKVIERARAEDAVAARSEWDAQFRADIAQFLTDEDIDGAVESGRKSLRYQPRTAYTAFVDPSGGRHDAMTMAIAHRTAAGKRVLDRLVIADPPFEPESTVERFAEVARSYGLRHVTGDRYAAEWVTSAFRRYGLRYDPSERDRSEIYLEMLPEFSGARIELLDEPRLLTELRLLERRPRPNGRSDSIDHPPRGTDDIANAACGALWMTAKARASTETAGRALYAIT